MMSGACPLLLRYQTAVGASGMSAKGHKQTSCRQPASVRKRRSFLLRRTERAFTAKPGPPGPSLVALKTRILPAVLSVLLPAAFLIAAPLIILLVTAAMIAGLV